MTTSKRTKLASRATIRDVAQSAGVKKTTVSRALNPEKRRLISDEAVIRVIEAAKVLGYRQNKLASALTRGRSQVIGVLLPDIENAVFPPIVRGIEERLATADAKPVRVTLSPEIVFRGSTAAPRRGSRPEG
jgi:LacI family transcriptional regulator